MRKIISASETDVYVIGYRLLATIPDASDDSSLSNADLRDSKVYPSGAGSRYFRSKLQLRGSNGSYSDTLYDVHVPNYQRQLFVPSSYSASQGYANLYDSAGNIRKLNRSVIAPAITDGRDGKQIELRQVDVTRSGVSGKRIDWRYAGDRTWRQLGAIYNGARGATGARGRTGPRGNPGTDGAAGARGLRGYTGATGATGRNGARGPQGDRGPAGPTGPAGPQGIQGLRGPAGSSTGTQGPAGDAGADGREIELSSARASGGGTNIRWRYKGQSAWSVVATIPDGATGAAGSRGVQGPAGPRGQSGQRGQRGAQGARGPAGASPELRAKPNTASGVHTVQWRLASQTPAAAWADLTTLKDSPDYAPPASQVQLAPAYVPAPWDAHRQYTKSESILRTRHWKDHLRGEIDPIKRIRFQHAVQRGRYPSAGNSFRFHMGALVADVASTGVTFMLPVTAADLPWDSNCFIRIFQSSAGYTYLKPTCMRSGWVKFSYGGHITGLDNNFHDNGVISEINLTTVPIRAAPPAPPTPVLTATRTASGGSDIVEFTWPAPPYADAASYRYEYADDSGSDPQKSISNNDLEVTLSGAKRNYTVRVRVQAIYRWTYNSAQHAPSSAWSDWKSVAPLSAA